MSKIVEEVEVGCLEGFPSAKKLKLEEKVSEEGHGHLSTVLSPYSSSSTNPQLQTPSPGPCSIASRLLGIEATMCGELKALEFGPPITHIYNPLHYAAKTHSDYVNRYGNSVKKILFVGMNPGPFGMAQNGVAFGDTAMVCEWLQVSGEVGKPAHEHPNRVIQGLACTRAEVSGSRFWGLFKTLCDSPQAFFSNCYVHNYCPFCFMNKSGKNITPPSLKAIEKAQLQKICDRALLEVIQLLGVQWVVGVGKFGADRAKAVLKANCAAARVPSGETSGARKSSACCGKRRQPGMESFVLHRGSGQVGGHGAGGKDVEVYVCSIMHPSPINPAANKGWAELATSQLSDLGLLDIIKAK